jgi:hypothetical protein
VPVVDIDWPENNFMSLPKESLQKTLGIAKLMELLYQKVKV